MTAWISSARGAREIYLTYEVQKYAKVKGIGMGNPQICRNLNGECEAVQDVVQASAEHEMSYPRVSAARLRSETGSFGCKGSETVVHASAWCKTSYGSPPGSNTCWVPVTKAACKCDTLGNTRLRNQSITQKEGVAGRADLHMTWRAKVQGPQEREEENTQRTTGALKPTEIYKGEGNKYRRYLYKQAEDRSKVRMEPREQPSEVAKPDAARGKTVVKARKLPFRNDRSAGTYGPPERCGKACPKKADAA
ncbi:hypothetical protein EDB85DRAFT_1895115 [Lactarius pseudohatsudake]|nr:hypothetical protein EDB85DRAFT_1895115 [Lactarius pseudohatsudake]